MIMENGKFTREQIENLTNTCDIKDLWFWVYIAGHMNALAASTVYFHTFRKGDILRYFTFESKNEFINEVFDINTGIWKHLLTNRYDTIEKAEDVVNDYLETKLY